MILQLEGMISEKSDLPHEEKRFNLISASLLGGKIMIDVKEQLFEMIK